MPLIAGARGKVSEADYGEPKVLLAPVENARYSPKQITDLHLRQGGVGDAAIPHIIHNQSKIHRQPPPHHTPTTSNLESTP
ncbi:MAG: hypothetical protein PVF83_05805 [Anaerolineales bacterium]